MGSGQALRDARRYEEILEKSIDPMQRPLFHLTPRAGWMNDPNGFCRFGGRYHLFYQYYPYASHWDSMHWGHAVSTDLLHWEYLPCALAPDEWYDQNGCFSGSALPLPDGRLMLMYTGVQPAGTFRRETQAQCVAFGDGVDFVKSPLNPVVRHAQLPEYYSAFDFRDPKVWMDETGTFWMVAGNRHPQRQGAILLFRSPDGLAWSFVTELDASCEAYGRMWECPDFFPLDGKQVLLVSPQEMHAREEFHAGFGTVALLGSYDEARTAFDRESVQPVDHGLNFYAPQTVLTPDGRRVMIGWMDNWETCKEAPRIHPWYAQMSMPRELRIKNGRLLQQPLREICSLWQDEIRHDAQIHEETSLPGLSGRLLDLSLTLDLTSSACRLFTLHLAKDAGHFVEIRCNLARDELVFDRSHGGSLRDIVHTRHVKAEAADHLLRLRVLMDKESMEVFIGEGERVLTSLVPTPMTAGGITMKADAPLHVTVEAHHLS